MVEYRRPIRYGEDVVIRSIRRDSGSSHAVHAALTVGDDVRAAILLRTL